MGRPEPKTTIVIPVWGPYGGDVLLEAVASLRAQDRPARIIVVDNASEDLLPGMEGVEVVRSPARLTVGGARNVGLRHVRTPFVMFWDADDLMIAGTLAFLEERLRARSDIVAAAAAILDDEPRRRHRWPPVWAESLARRRRLFAAVNCVWPALPVTGATLMRTAAARAGGGYAESNSGEQWALGAPLAFHGVELHPRPGLIYRRRVGSLLEERQSVRRFLSSAAAVDRRLLTVPCVPAWARLLAPLIAALQILVGIGARPLGHRLRGKFSHGRNISV
jgi:hypothetical protein